MITVLDRSVAMSQYGPTNSFELQMSSGRKWYISLDTKGYIPNIGDKFYDMLTAENAYEVEHKYGEVLDGNLIFILDDNNTLNEAL